jgi:hypothetical protein
MGVLRLPRGTVSSMHETVENLMWDMRFSQVLGYMPMTVITRSHPQLKRGIAKET